MRIKNIYGNTVNRSFSKYRIDWDRAVSGPQKLVKDCIYEDWKLDFVCEELVIPSSILRLDLVNFTQKVAVEVSPLHHFEYSEFLHKNRANFLKAIKADLKKIEWCESNGLTYVEIVDEDIRLQKLKKNTKNLILEKIKNTIDNEEQ